MGYDKEDVRQQASGRWSEILTQMGLPGESLDGRHQPCPKCGGTDRWRVFEDFEEKGGAICNACLPNAGDGFEVAAWWTGRPFGQVVNEVAEFLGMSADKKSKKPKPKKEETDPHTQVEITNWKPGLLPYYCHNNPGVAERGVTLAGTVFGKYQSKTVLLYKVFGEDLQTITGFVAMSATSRTLPKYRKNEAPEPVRKLNVKGTKSGLIGEESIKLIAAGGIVETVWKVEGPTDLAALISIIPPDQWGKHVAVTTPSGAGEKPRWISQFLSNAKQVCVIGDCDAAGQRGANEWVEDIAACGGSAKRIDLPYEFTETKGKDLRDFIQDEGPLAWGKLQELAEATKVFSGTSDSENATVVAGDIPAKYQQCLDDIGLDVLCQDPTSVFVYSSVTGRTGQIRGPVAKFQQEDLIQMVGIRGDAVVGDDIEGGYTIKQVRKSIAMAASARYVDDMMTIRGIGVYRGKDEAGDCIVVCNGSHLSVLDGAGNWRKVTKPRYGGLLFRFGSKNWFDHDEIGRLIIRARNDKEWVNRKWDELSAYFGRWTWKNQTDDPRLLSALVGATWIQDLWKYRPQISLRGESDAGKSSFCELLFGNSTSGELGVFGGLAVRIASSTAAGIRQTIGHTSYVICMDEFDSNSVKEKINVLKLLRTAGPGDTITMGTSHHHAIRFGMRATVWLSGVIVGLDEQMDKNRFLPFDILYPPDDRAAVWRFPTRGEIHESSVSTLAISIAYGLEASRIAAGLRQKIKGKKINKRIVEGLAGAAAIVALSATDNEDNALLVLDSFVDSVSELAMEEGQEKTHDEVLNEIEALTIPVGNQMQMTVATILADDADYCDGRSEVRTQLEAQLGIGKKTWDGKDYLVVHAASVAKRLGRGKSEVNQLLKRLCVGTAVRVTKLAKAPCRAVWIPWEYVRSRSSEEEVTEETKPRF